MNGFENALSTPLAEAIGWALLHLLWQGTLIAGIAAAAFALMRERSAAARYLVACGALLIMLAFPVATTWRIYEVSKPQQREAVATQSTEALTTSDVAIPLTLQTVKPLMKEQLARIFTPVVPWTFAIWLTGVALLSLRFVGGWMRAQSLCRSAKRASAEWQQRLIDVSDRMSLTVPIRLLESARIEVPMVIGWLRPVIVIPVSALTGLTAQQLETILAHELAHIRRNDYLVNLLQGVAETLLFYHPAMWWLSHRIRVERENCCDDLAVSVCGNPVLYARALTDLEQLRSAAMHHALAANGGSLKDRVVRLVVGREGTARCSYRWLTGMTVFSAAALLVVVAPLSLLASRHTLATERVAPKAPAKAAGTEVDVVAPRVNEDVDVDEDTDMDAEIDAAADVDVDIDPDVVITPEMEEKIARAEAWADRMDNDFDFDIDIDTPEAPEPPETPEVPVVVAPLAPLAPAAPSVRVPATPRAPAAPRVAPNVIVVPPIPPSPITPELRAEIREAMRIGAEASRDAAAAMARADRDLQRQRTKEKIRVRDLRCTSTDKLDAEDLVGFKALGIDGNYIRSFREAGYGNLCAEQLMQLKAMGIDSKDAEEFVAVGTKRGDVGALVAFRATGVTPSFIRAMQQAGLDDLSSNELVTLHVTGVDPEYVREMRKAGFADLSARQLGKLHMAGVDADYLQELRRAGYDSLSANDAIRMAHAGVDAEFIRELAKDGYKDLSVRDLITLRLTGMDPDKLHRAPRARD